MVIVHIFRKTIIFVHERYWRDVWVIVACHLAFLLFLTVTATLFNYDLQSLHQKLISEGIIPVTKYFTCTKIANLRSVQSNSDCCNLCGVVIKQDMPPHLLTTYN